MAISQPAASSTGSLSDSRTAPTTSPVPSTR